MSRRTMKFLPDLKEFLRLNGEIYTVRRYLYSTKEIEVENIGPCIRTHVGIVITKNNLRPYLAKSGFETIDSWWEKINIFIPYRIDKKYLWHVCTEKRQKDHPMLS